MICLSAKKHSEQGCKDARLDELLSIGERLHLESFIEAADNITRRHNVPLNEVTVLEDYYGKNYLAVSSLEETDYREIQDSVEALTGFRPPSICPPECGANLSVSQSFIQAYKGRKTPLINSALHHEAGHLVGRDLEIFNGVETLGLYLNNLIFLGQFTPKLNVFKEVYYLTAIEQKYGSIDLFCKEIMSLEKELSPRFERLSHFYGSSSNTLASDCYYGSVKLEELRSIVALPYRTRERISMFFITDIDKIAAETLDTLNNLAAYKRIIQKLDSAQKEFNRVLIANGLLRDAKNRIIIHTEFEHAFATSRELAADRFAAIHTGPGVIASALEELGSWEIKDKRWGDDFNPHPSIPERIRAIKKFAKQQAL